MLQQVLQPVSLCFVSIFVITLCKTQLSTEDRSFCNVSLIVFMANVIVFFLVVIKLAPFWMKMPVYRFMRSPCSLTMKRLQYQGWSRFGSTFQTGERTQTNGQTDKQKEGQTDGRYQVHYLPHFAVDKNTLQVVSLYILRVFKRSLNVSSTNH